MKRIGLEKINLYGCSCQLDMKTLVLARGKEPENTIDDYLINTRSLNPPYEDTLTMAANAAKKILTDEDKNDIGLLVVGTEGGLDFGKPISTNIHQALGLPNKVRNFETKFACYSGVAALDTAINWIASGLNKGKKALVIATDFSRRHFGRNHEFVLGGGAVAMIVSENPKVIEYDIERRGTWTVDAYDTFRPSAKTEMGNNEVSLYTYSDCLENSYEDYVDQSNEDIDFDTYFKGNIYHMPFPGMSFHAHRVLCNVTNPRPKKEVKESFDVKVYPSVRYPMRMGSCYGTSNFIGLLGFIKSVDDIKTGDRISFYSYGSGAIGEFYSGIILDGAKEYVENLKIDEELDNRKHVTVDEYEEVENARVDNIEKPDFKPDYSILNNFYDEHYKGKGLLVLKEVNDYFRTYDWS